MLGGNALRFSMKSGSHESLEVTNRNSYMKESESPDFHGVESPNQKMLFFPVAATVASKKYVPVQNSDARKWDWDDHFTPSKTYIMKVML